MQSPVGRPQMPIPPPPPSWWQRVRVRIGRLDRAGHRTALLVAGVIGGAVLAWLMATVVGLWLQPRFTVLELAAQRLAPDVDDAQPPIEQIRGYGAFDRRYTVQFPTPPGGLTAVVDNARRLRWQVTTRSSDGAVLRRDGVAAIVSVQSSRTRVQTRVAGWVRTRQRQAQLVAVAFGAALGGWSVWSQVRRLPRPVGRAKRDKRWDKHRNRQS